MRSRCSQCMWLYRIYIIYVSEISIRALQTFRENGYTTPHSVIDYNVLQLEPLKLDIQRIQIQQHVILILLILLFVLCGVRYLWKCLLWIKHKHCVPQLVKKLRPRKSELTTTQNGKDLGGTTIQNMCAIQNEVDRAPSQIFSVTAAEGSVMTMTTPISSRYPAENTTPTTEYTYDNQALAVTPVSEKPTSSGVM
ncbi:grindelwald isoform 2-T2 [Glossina fuscipes fuscipes]